MRKIFLSLALTVMAITMTSCNKKGNSAPQPAEEPQVEQQQAEANKQPAPNFTLNDLNGKPLTLSSLKGKPVVLDFWGSWCVWCVRGVPKMKEYYNKYQGKFEILGIDCNEDETTWKNAVKELELPWLHVYCPEGSSLLSDYGIQGFPTKIIIDAEGNVDRIVVGEDPECFQRS